MPGKYDLLSFQIHLYEKMLNGATDEGRIKFLKQELEGFYNISKN